MTALKPTSGRGLAQLGRGVSDGWGQTHPILLPSLFILSRPPNVLLHHLLAPPRRAMIYPQLAQPSTPASPLHFTLLTPDHNLLCHPDLLALSNSKQTTTHGWSQRSQDVNCPLAQSAPAQVKASGLTVGGQSPPS